MQEIHKIVLRTLEPWLLDNMSVSIRLMAKLCSTFVITEEEKEMLQSKEETSRKVAMLVNILTRKDDGAFSKFQRALEHDEQQTVAQHLRQKEQALEASSAFPLDVAVNISLESAEKLRKIEKILYDAMEFAAISVRDSTASGDTESASGFINLIKGITRTIRDIRRECIIICVVCPTPTSLIELLDLHRSGKLKTSFEQEFSSIISGDVITITVIIELLAASKAKDDGESSSKPNVAESSTRTMAHKYIKFIRGNRAKLTETIDLDSEELLNELLEKNIITKVQQEHIMRGDAISKTKAVRLLAVLEKRSDEQFEEFCRILHSSTGQTGAAKILNDLAEDDYNRLFGNTAI